MDTCNHSLADGYARSCTDGGKRTDADKRWPGFCGDAGFIRRILAVAVCSVGWQRDCDIADCDTDSQCAVVGMDGRHHRPVHHYRDYLLVSCARTVADSLPAALGTTVVQPCDRPFRLVRIGAHSAFYHTDCRNSTVSFLIATAVIAAVCIGNGKICRVRRAFAKGNPWWMWLGGVCGAISVFGNAWLIPQIGTGAFFMALLLGQMALSLLMEGRGWMGAMKRHITFVQLVGITLMVVGVALIRL